MKITYIAPILAVYALSNVATAQQVIPILNPELNNENRDNIIFTKFSTTAAGAIQGLPGNTNIPVSCNEEETIVYFGNGINNGYNEAISGAYVLDDGLKEELDRRGLTSSFGDRRTALAFNRSYPFAKAFSFLDAPSDSAFVKDYFTKVWGDVRQINTAVVFDRKGINKVLPPKEREKYQLKVAEFYQKALDGSVPATAFDPAYDLMMDLGRKSILVSHSHGTIISNIAYPNLESADAEKGFGVIHAASMQDYVAGSDRFFSDDPYVTIQEDGVASAFKLGIGTNFPYNVDEYDYTNSFDGSSMLFFGGHRFDDFYMTKANGKGSEDILSLPAKGIARRDLMDWVVRYSEELQNKPCTGHVYSHENGTDYLGYSMSGGYLEYETTAKKLLTETAVTEAGYVDWKGRYEMGEATRILSWRGPTMRYHGAEYPVSNVVYRWGRPVYLTPGEVVGAAIQTDPVTGLEYIIVLTRESNGADSADVKAYRKLASNYLKKESEWTLVGNLIFSIDSKRHSPWFFNNDGTKAVTLIEENKSLEFEKRNTNASSICTSGNTEEVCVPGDSGYFAPYDEGPQTVTVLTPVEANFSNTSLPNTSYAIQSSENGDSAILAVDFDNDTNTKLVLREVNPITARGDRGSPDSPASFGRWLTINNVDFTTPDIIDCET